MRGESDGSTGIFDLNERDAPVSRPGDPLEVLVGIRNGVQSGTCRLRFLIGCANSKRYASLNQWHN
jgi:hypothetical protein